MSFSPPRSWGGRPEGPGGTSPPHPGGGRREAPGGGNRTALIICGALGPEVKEIAGRRGWDVDIHGLSAYLHLYPNRIVSELSAKLRELRPRYDRLVVVYGDCGTAGRLDPVLDEVGAARVPGPHCYEMFAGKDLFERVMDERPGTFFLTDWLVRNFERAVIRGLGLDRHPDLRPMLFGNYEALLYLRQVPSEPLAARAAAISGYLDLPLEIRDVGLGELETRLAELVG
jgi:hypothetical protein